MKNISAKNADVLAEHFGSLTKLAGASKEELMAVGNLQFPGDREKISIKCWSISECRSMNRWSV